MARGKYSDALAFEDPAKLEGTEEEKLAKFREVPDLIKQRVQSWVTEKNLA